MCNPLYYNSCEKGAQTPSLLVMKHKPKDCSSYTVNLVWLQSGTREPCWLYYLKSVFLEMPIVTIYVDGFPKSGHNLLCRMLVVYNEHGYCTRCL